MFITRTALCLSWARWKGWWWSAGGDTTLTTWSPQLWQWSPWSLCTGAGKRRRSLKNICHLSTHLSYVCCVVSTDILKDVNNWEAWLNEYSQALTALCCTVCFRIAVFSVSVLHDERIVVVAEQRAGCLRRRQLPVDEPCPSGTDWALSSSHVITL